MNKNQVMNTNYRLGVVAVLTILVASSVRAAVFSDDFTSNTLPSYRLGLAYKPSGSRVGTIAWDGVSAMNGTSVNAEEYATMLHTTWFRNPDSSVSLTILAPPLGDEYPPQGWKVAGVMISDTLLDDTTTGGFANFKGFTLTVDGTAAYFEASRFNGGVRTSLGFGNPPGGGAWWATPMTLTIQATSGVFNFYFRNANTITNELLFSDSSGTLNDASLKYFGLAWGTQNASPNTSQWNPVRFDLLGATSVWAVPEPSVMMLWAGGLAALWLTGRRRLATRRNW